MNAAAFSLFLIGPMGAGKTAIGRRLARILNYPFIDADDELEQRTGVRVSLIFELEGEQGFRERESALLNELTQYSSIVLATGGGAILSPDNRRHLRERGIAVYLRTSVELQLQRLANDRRRPLLQHPDREQRLREMAEIRNPLYESSADITVDSANIRVAPMTRRVLEAIRSYQQYGHSNNNDEISQSGVG